MDSSDPISQIKQSVINLALLGASPSAIAYKLSKDGYDFTPGQINDLLQQWEHDIDMERELRAVLAKQSINDIVARLEKNMPILEQILQEAMKKNRSKSSIEAVKEMNQLLAKIYELIAEVRAMEAAEQLSGSSRIKSVYRYVIDNFPAIAPLIPDEALRKAGLVRMAEQEMAGQDHDGDS